MVVALASEEMAFANNVFFEQEQQHVAVALFAVAKVSETFCETLQERRRSFTNDGSGVCK